MIRREDLSDLIEEMATLGLLYVETEKSEWPEDLLSKMFELRLGKLAARMRELQATIKTRQAQEAPEREAV